MYEYRLYESFFLLGKPGKKRLALRARAPHYNAGEHSVDGLAVQVGHTQVKGGSGDISAPPPTQHDAEPTSPGRSEERHLHTKYEHRESCACATVVYTHRHLYGAVVRGTQEAVMSVPPPSTTPSQVFVLTE